MTKGKDGRDVYQTDNSGTVTDIEIYDEHIVDMRINDFYAVLVVMCVGDVRAGGHDVIHKDKIENGVLR